MEEDDRIRELLKVTPSPESRNPLTDKVLRRARAGVGQRDTLLFAIVRIWTVIAELLAPVFAQLAERQARFSAGKMSEDMRSGEQSRD